jgi:hypothetical protein
MSVALDLGSLFLLRPRSRPWSLARAGPRDGTQRKRGRHAAAAGRAAEPIVEGESGARSEAPSLGGCARSTRRGAGAPIAEARALRCRDHERRRRRRAACGCPTRLALAHAERRGDSSRDDRRARAPRRSAVQRFAHVRSRRSNPRRRALRDPRFQFRPRRHAAHHPPPHIAPECPVGRVTIGEGTRLTIGRLPLSIDGELAREGPRSVSRFKRTASPRSG